MALLELLFKHKVVVASLFISELLEIQKELRDETGKPKEELAEILQKNSDFIVGLALK